MAKVRIEQSHDLDAADVRKRLDTLQAKLAQRYGIEGKWVSDKEALISRTGAKGSIKCEPNKVVVELDLSFLLTPMKDKIEHRVREELAHTLADGATAPTTT